MSIKAYIIRGTAAEKLTAMTGMTQAIKPAALLAVLGAGMISAGIVAGQDFPNRFVRIVTTEAGSTSDFTSRVMAQALPEFLGQTVIVDNRGNIAGEVVARAAPDGYTLVAWGSPLWLAPFMRKTSYDPVKDFAPVVLMTTSPNLLVVHPSLPVTTVKDLIALAKRRPGQLLYSSPGPGGSPHLAAELLKSMAGINIVHIAYRGMGSALTALASGEVQLMFPNAAAAAPYLRSGRIRALAVTTEKPTTLAPGLPTLAAALPGYESVGVQGILAPAGTPATIVQTLNQAFVKALRKDSVRERLLNSGAEPVGGTPEAFAAIIKTDIEKMGKLIRDSGIRPD